MGVWRASAGSLGTPARARGRRAGRRWSPAAKALLALGSAALALTAAELGARLALGERFVRGSFTGIPYEALGRFDPELGWANLAGARTRVVAAQFAYQASINAKGLRDREHPYTKPPGVARVLLLGDSVAWGWGVDDGETLGDRLEERLAPDAEVVNLAVPGYSTDQELWALEGEGRSYAPDLVLLCFVLNDLSGNETLSTTGLGKPRYARGADGAWTIENRPVRNPGAGKARPGSPPLLLRLHSRSALLQLLVPDRAVDQLLASDAPEDPESARKRARFLEESRAKADALCDRLADRASVHAMLLAQLKARCDELGAELVVTCVPHHHDHHLYNPDAALPAELATPDAERDAALRTRLSRELESYGAELGFRVLPVEPALLAAARRGELLCVADGHLNARGNELVAEALAAQLRPLLAARRGAAE